ncbi:MAG: 2-(1,2-epoxy-1,2-dihydrophenyl)acetyl-CoA isomerase PaaG [Candidatus Zixiibacteriota bacterium]
MTSGQIKVTTQDRVATITIDRPDKLNALTPEMRRALLASVRECDRKPDVRVIVITGAGRAFCAGGDIGHLRDLKSANDEAGFVRLLDEGRQLIDLLRRTPKPTIAMVNGPAYGAGFFVAIACDLRICSETASFGAPFVKLGLGPDWGGTYLLPRLVGTAKALEMLYTGEGISAEDAVAIGLANRLYSESELPARVARLAESLSHHPADVIARNKRAIYRTLNGSFSTTAEIERRFQLENFRSPQFAEGIAAFLEKRPPRFE